MGNQYACVQSGQNALAAGGPVHSVTIRANSDARRDATK